MQLLMKSLYAGEASGMTWQSACGCRIGIIEPLIEQGRAEQLVEVRGASGTGAASYRYASPTAGRVGRGSFSTPTAMSAPPRCRSRFTSRR